ncbi:toprim domain-containing protein [Nocardia sp. NPDC057668]|uniref:toprim domain-containing protein n=1 Tax=Nocardia sp. NPDC057668 TaxID=3346202 RepID=UPI00366CF176
MSVNHSWDTITAALQRVSGPGRRGGEWLTYLCPVHEADGRRHHPSLGVVYNRQRGRTVVRCFAGCSDEEVLYRLGLGVRDLFDRPGPGALPRRPGRAGAQVQLADRALQASGLSLEVHRRDLGARIGRPHRVATYLYRRADGAPAGRIIRAHIPHRYGHAKTFWQERYGEHGWEPGGFEPLPYRLPEVLAAVRAGRDIVVCEGEADTLTAVHAGLAATCNAGGAQGWRPEHGRMLAGARRVWIIADRDAPGYRHADRVARSIEGLVGRIRVVQARDGKDLTDHCNAGHHIPDLDPVPVLDDHYRGL